MFISMLMPDASRIIRSFTDKMATMSGNPEDINGFLTAAGSVDVRQEAMAIRAPTLIIHVRGDQVAPLVLGEQASKLIHASRLVIIEGRDHVPVPGDGEGEQIAGQIRPFLNQDLPQGSATATP